MFEELLTNYLNRGKINCETIKYYSKFTNRNKNYISSQIRHTVRRDSRESLFGIIFINSND